MYTYNNILLYFRHQVSAINLREDEYSLQTGLRGLTEYLESLQKEI
jgi:hypothetical protein